MEACLSIQTPFSMRYESELIVYVEMSLMAE